MYYEYLFVILNSKCGQTLKHLQIIKPYNCIPKNVIKLFKLIPIMPSLITFKWDNEAHCSDLRNVVLPIVKKAIYLSKLHIKIPDSLSALNIFHLLLQNCSYGLKILKLDSGRHYNSDYIED